MGAYMKSIYINAMSIGSPKNFFPSLVENLQLKAGCEELDSFFRKKRFSKRVVYFSLYMLCYALTF
jgi:hypothetical protein